MKLPIEGYEGKYEIDEQGNIYSLRKGIILSPYVQKNRNKGYLRVNLNPKKFMVHVLVAKTFLPNPDNKPYVNHKDKNTFNNHKDNLEWCTAQENAEHALSKNYSLVSPTGVVVEVFNLCKFCRDNNLMQPNMDKVVKGKRNHHKGWKRFELA